MAPEIRKDTDSSPVPEAGKESAVTKAKPTVEQLQVLLEKSLAASEKILAENVALRAKLSKDVPPKDDVEQAAGGVKHNPTKEEEDDHPHPDNTTRHAPNLAAGTGDAFVGKDLKALEERIVAKAIETVRAQTPIPMGFVDSPEVRALVKGDIKALINKAIEIDRANSGFHAEFGHMPGTREAHLKTERQLSKMLYGR